ncbi:reverse transcriptase family protein [Methylomonas sp. TEB]|uniref:reverse transcriptase family protein n=1 Tax=Methylomonas sp. TEB TaxID=3398229 RepID=UPI0039F591EA
MVSNVGYDYKSSPFYRLPSKKKLASLLDFELSDFDNIVNKSNYRILTNKQGRLIQHPIGKLEILHKRIANLLFRIKTPNYVHSCKNHSYITNAKSHKANVPLIKTDITSFYPSVTFSSIFKLFNERFECPNDIAWHLAYICSYNRSHLPTGSSLSSIIAFLAHQDMFDEICELSQQHGCVMTCYVDDIVISGVKASKTLLYKVRDIIKNHGLYAKRNKSKTFPANKPRTVTGVIVTNDGLKIPNCRLQRTKELRKHIGNENNELERERLIRSLQGRLQEEEQIRRANSASRLTVGE